MVVVTGEIDGRMVNWLSVFNVEMCVCVREICVAGCDRLPRQRKETWDGAIFWDCCLACLPFCVLYALGRLCPALHWFVCRWLAGPGQRPLFLCVTVIPFFAFFWLALQRRATCFWKSGIAGGDFSLWRRSLSRCFLMGLHTALRTLGDYLQGIFSSSGLSGCSLVSRWS